MTDEDKATLTKMVHDGYTDREIADALCYSISHIRNQRRLFGLWKNRGGNRDGRMQKENY